MKKFNRILSILMSLCLISSLTLPALAAEYYLEDGSVTVEATSTDGGATQIQTVTQNGTTVNDAAPVVTQRDSSTATSNNITIESSNGATAVVTVENVNIDTGSDTSGGDTSAIDVENGSQVIITVSGENHVNAGHDVNGNHDYRAAVHVGDSTVVIQGDSDDAVLNTSVSNSMGAAIGSDLREDFTGTVIIQDVKVEAEGNSGAGIGSGMHGENSGTILIDGAEVDAKSTYEAAGIGAGTSSDFSGTVIISGQSTVTAAGELGSGIGGGFTGDYSGTVIVADGSTVEANGTDVGIGSSDDGDFSGTVVVAEDSNVTAKSDDGAGIGCLYNGHYSGTVIQETGSTITASGGMGGKGLGAYESHEAEVKDEVDLTQYPAAPAAPTPLPWNEAMFQTPEAQPEPTPAAQPEPKPVRVADTFWSDVEKQLRAAKKGDTVTVDAAWRTTMPASVMDAVAETGVTLIIKWNSGEDITIEKPYDGEKQYTVFKLKELTQLLAD